MGTNQHHHGRRSRKERKGTDSFLLEFVEGGGKNASNRKEKRGAPLLPVPWVHNWLKSGHYPSPLNQLWVRKEGQIHADSLPCSSRPQNQTMKRWYDGRYPRQRDGNRESLGFGRTSSISYLSRGFQVSCSKQPD